MGKSPKPVPLRPFVPKASSFGPRAIFMFSLCSLMFVARFSKPFFAPKTERKLSHYLGDGLCEWTQAEEISTDTTPFGTLFASYPASGMRITWQQTQGLTGIRVHDDFFDLATEKMGLVKTQYPHYEGIWSYGQNMDQVILLIRNPRWALPSYLFLLNELDFSHTFTMSKGKEKNLFQKRANMEDWINWRDYLFDQEIMLWGYHIDFYMYNGLQYWMDLDYERNGQYPFRFLNDTDLPWPQDIHCLNDIAECRPKVIISFEKLRNDVTGPDELRKIANALRGKDGMSVMPDDGINCIWHKTFEDSPEPSNKERDKHGLPATAYNFTIEQMQTIEDKLVEYKEKYSSGIWVNNTLAQDLVFNFELYLGDVRSELIEMEANPPATLAPNGNRKSELVNWYNSKGKGNRYAIGKVREMGIWEQVKHFYQGHPQYNNTNWPQGN